MKKKIVLIKIGGSLITDKNKPFFLKEEALKKIAQEIKRAQEESGRLLIVGHGSGSFGHVPAKKYRIAEGIINEQSYLGMAETQDAASRFNRIVVKKLIQTGLRAFSVSPSSCYLTQNGEPIKICLDPIKKLMELEMLPVLYGDVVFDTQKGCCILSTEKVLGSLALLLKKEGFPIEKIIYCGKTNGVLNQAGATIPLITPANFKNYQQNIGQSEGTDVTGGMSHKVFEALQLAKKGIPGLIIDGITNGILSAAVSGEKVLGTEIKKD